MRVVLFAHSLVSCWNHGNAHFLRGIVREFSARGHEVRVWEPPDGWSRTNLMAEYPDAETGFAAAFPALRSETYREDVFEMLDGADLVLVHEWTDPAMVARIGRARTEGGRFTLFFHDTHHRAVSDPEAIRAFDLDGYDGVLAFGAALAEIYRSWGWGSRVHVWHEAADSALFRPPAVETARDGLIWIGNWGDGERTAELETFLLSPARDAGLALDVHGVRYPVEAQALLTDYGARLPGLDRQCRRPGRVRPPPRHDPRPAPLLHDGTARHSDDPRVRGAGLRHSVAVGPVGRCGAPVPAGRLLGGSRRPPNDRPLADARA